VLTDRFIERLSNFRSLFWVPWMRAFSSTSSDFKAVAGAKGEKGLSGSGKGGQRRWKVRL